MLPSCGERLPFQGPIPPIRGKCPEGTKGVGMLSAKQTERLSQIRLNLSVSAPPSHLPWKGSREVVTDLHENPNRKFSLRFGKEETSTEDKRRRLRRLVPSRSFLTRLRRPYLFSRKRKDWGEKSAWTRLVLPASEFRWEPIF